MQKCGNCRFFLAELVSDEAGDPVEVEGGLCREDSPKAAMRGQLVEDDIEIVWPWVAIDDWCGRWKKGSKEEE